jgi:hypothetical protein
VYKDDSNALERDTSYAAALRRQGLDAAAAFVEGAGGRTLEGLGRHTGVYVQVGNLQRQVLERLGIVWPSAAVVKGLDTHEVTEAFWAEVTQIGLQPGIMSRTAHNRLSPLVKGGGSAVYEKLTKPAGSKSKKRTNQASNSSSSAAAAPQSEESIAISVAAIQAMHSSYEKAGHELYKQGWDEAKTAALMAAFDRVLVAVRAGEQHQALSVLE